MLRRIFDSVINQVADHLEQKVAVALDHHSAFQALLERLVLILSQGLIELTGIGDQLIQRHRFHVGGITTGFQAGDAQQCVEGGQQLIGLRHGAAGLLPRLVVIHRHQRVFKLVAESGQGRAQIVGNTVGNVPDALHQIHNPVQHLIEVFRQLVEIIVGATGWYPQGKVAVHDPT